MSRLIGASVSAAVLAMSAGCADDSGRGVTLEAWPQVGRTIEVVAEVNGDVSVGTAEDDRWFRSIRVDGELVASVVVVDPEGELVRCSIDLGDGEVVAAVGNGEARCSVAGEVGADRVDVESDRFGAVRPPQPDDETTAEVATGVELVEGVIFADVPGSWTIVVDPPADRPGAGVEAGEVEVELADESDEAHRFSADRLEVLARLSDPDSSSSVAVARVRNSSEIDDSLDDLIDELSDETNPNDTGSVIALGAARVGRFGAVRYAIDVPDRRISWFLLRVEEELIVVTAVDADRDGAVARVLDSFRPSP